MAINEIFRAAKREIDSEIKVLKEQHRLKLRQKDQIIAELKRQLAERTQPSHELKDTKTKEPDKRSKAFSPERLRQLRKKRGLTQIQMAKLLGVSHPTYCSWENGRNIPRATFRKGIADFSKMGNAAFWKKLNETFPNTPLSVSKGSLSKS